MQSSAVLWTGGKDCSLALYEARRDGYEVDCLVTFAPLNPKFLAHPPGFIKMQAQALLLPHYIVSLSEPFEKSYEDALCKLRNEMGINTVITGDIAEVGGSPNWIRERSRPVGMNVHTPLWGCDRLALLQQQLATGFQVIFSCVNTRWLEAGWVGRELDDAAIADLRCVRDRTGLDLCGEEGEYHTLVTDGPSFTRPIRIRSHSKRTQDFLAYMEIHALELAAP
jgi:diphthine-ammonia ligase